MNFEDIMTPRLRLCIPNDRHVELLPRVLNDPEIERNTLSIPYPFTRDDAVKAIEKFTSWVARDIGQVRMVELRDNSELIGTVGLEFHDGKRRGELGYVIGRPWWGRGYVTEAAQAMIDYGFQEVGFEQITAHAMVHNPASSRVLQKLRFQSEGVIRGACRKHDRAIDADGYSMSREQWRDLRRGA